MKKLLWLILLLFSYELQAACVTIIAPTADAATSNVFRVSQTTPGLYPRIEVHAASGLTASEFTDLQSCHDGTSSSCQDVYDSDGSQVRLSSTTTTLRITAFGHYRVVMDDPTNATGVYLCLSGQDNH